MADTKISALADVVTLAAGDKVPVADASDLTVSKSATMTEINTYLQTIGQNQIAYLSSRYTNATTTGTEVTQLSFNNLVAGTYFIRWVLLYEAAAATSSIKFGVNCVSAVNEFVANVYFPSAGVSAATGTMHDANNATTGQVWAYANTRTETTTAPNLGPWIATTNAAVPHLLILETLVVQTGTGDIELWCASEVAFEISLEVGSSGICVRTN